MKQVVKVKLENEMDLILANKRTMKLAELCGLSVITQTALATAVSEIARFALSGGKNTTLSMGITTLPLNKKQLTAVVSNTNEMGANMEAINFAKKLITEVQVIRNGSFHEVQLNQEIKFKGLITDTKIESFIEYFKSEPPLSPYDEIRKKNIQLLEFSDRLKESEYQYRSLAETLPLMMFSATPAGNIIQTNQWFKDYFGISITELVPFAETLVHPDDYETLNKDWEKILKSQNSFHTQGRLKHQKSGNYLWHLISIVPVKNEKNKVIQWTGFFADINAQKLVEETLKDNLELKEAQKKLLDYQLRLEEKISELNISNNELEQFAYIASHDLQEPLRKIITFSSLLGEKLTDLDSVSRLYFSKIIASSKRMTVLINDVLDYSRIARTKEDFTPIDLNEIVENVKSDFELLIQQKQAVLEISPLPVVKGDRLQMMQLFSNLISNALKFCKTTPLIKITSSNLSLQEIQENYKLDGSSGYTKITVSDNGIGFEPEYSEQIFKIFKRLHGNSEYNGTGIGLALCKKIAENHSGVISASGKPDQGATFTIIIPQ